MMMAKQKMQIVHLSTSSTGGAGTAAMRLHNALLRRGFQSIFCSVSNVENYFDPTVRSVRRTKVEKSISKLLALFNLLVSGKTYFSFNSKNLKSLEKLILALPPTKTIIHVHNWFNLTNLDFLSQMQNKGFHLVFTLHDMRLITGGCHVAIECEKFKQKCVKCPNIAKPLQIIPKLFHASQSKLDNLYLKSTFICPSQWILSQAKMSSLLANANLVGIYNHIDFFKLTEPRKQRKGLLNVGTASISNDSYFKGDDLIRELEKFSNSPSSKFQISKLKDFPQTLEGCEEFWAGIDCLLVPSRADNSPNVIHEAKVRGIPVIGSAVGGIPELLNDFVDVLIPVPSLDISFIVQSLQEFSERTPFPKEHLTIQAEYLKLINNPLQQVLSTYNSLVVP